MAAMAQEEDKKRKRVAAADADLAAVGKDLFQFLRRNHFELRISAIARLLIGAPSAELRHVTESVSLHVLVRNLHYEFGSQRFPRQVFTLTPAALPARHALDAVASRGFGL